jgi:arylsulfatase A-like enzyme
MWNMAEGSFAQREAFVAPTPATIAFRLRVPIGATLDVAPAVLAVGDSAEGGSAGDVEFVVRAIPSGSPAIELHRETIAVGARDRWIERRIDLSSIGGREVELELVTSTTARVVTANPPAAIALWGTPQIVARAPAKVPYDVLWIVIDSLRPDVIASFHDDAFDDARKAARIPPGYALLPKIEGLTPNLDALAQRGAVFRRASSAAPWTRPGTIAMLTGVHSEKLGVSTLPWSLPESMLDAYYASKPPALALSFRHAGAATRAFVNNNFMLGYSQVGIDLGFEHVEDYRYRTLDTEEITRAALASMRAHADERRFLFVNYNSPHDPYDPTPECLARVPAPPERPKKKHDDDPEPPMPKSTGPLDPRAIRDPAVRAYMAEACKDDAAVGALMAEIDREGKRDRTLVIVTADHGETLSDRHEMVALGLDEVRTRFHHAFGHWEETTRIPILLSLPGVIPEGAKVDGRITNLDLAPTILDLEHLELDPRQNGLDLLPFTKGAPVPVRPIVSMGRASQALFWDRYRYVHRDEAAQKVLFLGGEDSKTATIRWELFDLVDDPGEQHNLGGDPDRAALVEELRARMKAALEGVPTADVKVVETANPKVHLRFAGAAGAHRVQVTLRASDGATLHATPVFLGAESITQRGSEIDLAATTAIDALVGVDVEVTPPTAALRWTITIDDKPIGDDAIYGGMLGVSAVGLAKGLTTPAMRALVSSPLLPFVDPAIDFGVFVTRDPASGEAHAIERASSGAAAAEVQSALKSWGYAK